MKESRRRRTKGIPHVALIIETSTAYGRAIIRGATQVHPRGGAVDRLYRAALAPGLGPAVAGELGRRRDHLPRIDPAERPGHPRHRDPDGRPQRPGDGPGAAADPQRPRGDRAAGGRAPARSRVPPFRLLRLPGLRVVGAPPRRVRRVRPCRRRRVPREERTPRVSWGHQQSSWEGEVDGAARWIKKLPKPLGVLAGNDPRGIQLLDACRRAGVAVPEEVAVVGVDNDELVCELAYPPLSSVIPDAFRIGYEAAALLDRLMKGEAAPAAMQTIPPHGRGHPPVVGRDRHRRPPARRRHAVHPRARLRGHRRRRRARSPGRLAQRAPATVPQALRPDHPRHDHRRAHRSASSSCSTETDLPLADIAQRAGFAYMEYLSTTFRRQTGWTPSAYRREFARRWEP